MDTQTNHTTHHERTVEEYHPLSEAELHGSVFLALYESIHFPIIKPHIATTLAAYGHDILYEDVWYLRRMYLDILKRIATSPQGTNHLLSVGIKMIDTILLPADVTVHSLWDAAHLLCTIYQTTHRCLPPDEIGYEVQEAGKNHIRIIDHSPYPHDLSFGYIFGLFQHFKSRELRPSLQRTFANLYHPDCNLAIYDITW